MSYHRDQDITKKVPGYRRMLVFLTPSRDQASVFFEQTIDLTKTLPWMENKSRELGCKISFTHLFIAAVGRTFHLNPNLNRYVSGHRIYQRDGVSVSISAKKELKHGSKIVLLKVPVAHDDGVEQIVTRFSELLKEGRSGRDIAQEKEVSLFLKLPAIFLRPLIRLVQWLDRRHLLPSFFVDPDPLFTSIVVANLGSLGLSSAYHHLYEYGNAPFFAVIGKTRKEVFVEHNEVKTRDVLDIKYTFDERIEDGLACALGLASFKELVENPDKLESGVTDWQGHPPRQA